MLKKADVFLFFADKLVAVEKNVPGTKFIKLLNLSLEVTHARSLVFRLSLSLSLFLFHWDCISKFQKSVITN